MGKLINVGFGNIVNSSKVIAIISPESAPIKRMIQGAKDEGLAIDATCGRRTRAVIVTESNHIILSALQPETIANRLNHKEGIEMIHDSKESTEFKDPTEGMEVDDE